MFLEIILVYIQNVIGLPFMFMDGHVAKVFNRDTVTWSD